MPVNSVESFVIDYQRPAAMIAATTAAPTDTMIKTSDKDSMDMTSPCSQ
jgi:hypothetical protein